MKHIQCFDMEQDLSHNEKLEYLKSYKKLSMRLRINYKFIITYFYCYVSTL